MSMIHCDMTSVEGQEPPRPKALKVRFFRIPQTLKDLAQWVLWKYTLVEGKWTKPPYCARTGRKASTTDTATWASYQEALAALKKGAWDGIGIVLTPENSFTGIDLDHCRDAATGEVESWAAEIVRKLNSYTEVSPSGNGLRIIAEGHRPDRERSKRGPVEMYDGATKDGQPGGRFLTITGHRIDDVPVGIEQRQDAIAGVYHVHLKAQAAKPQTGEETTPSSSAPELPDAEVLRLAREAAYGEKFTRLWKGDKSGYNSASEADLALCGLLAASSRGNAEQVDRLFRRSGLMRLKWERDGYRSATIAKALSGRTEYYQPGQAKKQLSGQAEREPSQATQLIEMVRHGGCKLWHSPDGEAYVTLPEADHFASCKVQSKRMRLWLGREFYLLHGKALGSSAVNDALGILEGMALHNGEEHPVYLRVAGQEGRVYLDLGDPRWRAVEIDEDGWRLVDMPSVKFRRAKAMRPLPDPVSGGNLDLIRDFVNIEDASYPLLVGWLVAALRPTGPFPVLCLHGEHGSAKSTTARLLRSLVDPNTAPIRAEPKDTRDLAVAANHGWVVALDNLSRLTPSMSDALCRLSTGGGFATRTLYSDDDETIFEAQRPVILTGIEEVTTRSDLLDRSVLVHLPTIPEERRRTESELWTAWERVRPLILGALLDAVSAGLRRLPDVRLERLPRLADFATWALACEPALGLDDGTFLTAYEANRESSNDVALDSHPVGRHLIALASDSEWTGTASDLLGVLTALATECERKMRIWPHTARALSGVVRRLASNLRQAGVGVAFERQAGGRRIRTIRVHTIEAGDDRPDRPERPGTPGMAGEPGRWRDAGGTQEDRAGTQTLLDGTVGDGRDGDSPSRPNDKIKYTSPRSVAILRARAEQEVAS
jgi:hypothetical protein